MVNAVGSSGASQRLSVRCLNPTPYLTQVRDLFPVVTLHQSRVVPGLTRSRDTGSRVCVVGGSVTSVAGPLTALAQRDQRDQRTGSFVAHAVAL